MRVDLSKSVVMWRLLVLARALLPAAAAAAPPREERVDEDRHGRVGEARREVVAARFGRGHAHGVGATSRHHHAVEVAVRESTRRVWEPRQFRDGFVPRA